MVYKKVESFVSGVYQQIAQSQLKRVQPLVNSILVATAIATGVVVGVRHVGGFQQAELVTFDWMMRSRYWNRGKDERLLLVAITEADIQQQQQWPLSDRLVAQVLEKISRFEPAVIGLDLYRDVPQEPGHQELRSQLRSLPNLIGITKLADSQDPGVPAPPILPPDAIGFNDIVTDPDGVVRRNLLFAATGNGDTSFSFALRVALRYLSLHGISLKNNPQNPLEVWLGKAKLTPLTATSGGYQSIDADGYQILFNYRSPGAIARTVRLTDILHDRFDPSWIKDKIVLIGTTAPSEKDLFFTPYGEKTQTENFQMPGVRVHIQMLSQILSSALDGDPLFWYWPDWVEVLWIALWGLSGAVVAAQIQHPVKLGVAVVVGVGGIFAIGFGLFHWGGWIPLVSPTVTFAIATSSMVASKLVYNAFHDDLTGLPNRALFMKQLERINRRLKPKATSLPASSETAPEDTILSSVLAVLFLDVDRFKIVNDGLGHEVGDRLLCAIVERIHKTLAKQHYTSGLAKIELARVGGDEFAILLENLDSTENAIYIAEDLYRQLTLPFDLNGHEIYTSASIGMAISSGGEKRNLLRDAHTAMYRAKALGKPRPQVFEGTMQHNAVARLALETDLRRAIAEGVRNVDGKLSSQFIVYYQPLICLKTGKIAGFEALVRWQHPERGLVFPGEFIPLAEETGAIVPLGELVLQMACWQIGEWHQLFPSKMPLIVSVNLSGKQFAQPNLIEMIEDILNQTNLNPAYLKLEITETVVMDEVESAIAMLSKLKSLDLKLGIDDFGTGYSSLSYLHLFPTDTLKVDRSFVSRMSEADRNTAIVKTIVALAHNLKMDVIAEGVETPEQLAILRSLGCEYGQGYFFAKPLPPNAAQDLLKADPVW